MESTENQDFSAKLLRRLRRELPPSKWNYFYLNSRISLQNSNVIAEKIQFYPTTISFHSIIRIINFKIAWILLQWCIDLAENWKSCDLWFLFLSPSPGKVRLSGKSGFKFLRWRIFTPNRCSAVLSFKRSTACISI